MMNLGGAGGEVVVALGLDRRRFTTAIFVRLPSSAMVSERKLLRKVTTSLGEFTSVWICA